MNKDTWQKLFFQFGIFGGTQFLILTLLAMWIYPGGTIHAHGLESYDFFYNYFSDLGRTHAFDGTSNRLGSLTFRITLTISGVCLILFFIALPVLFENAVAKGLIIVAVIFGVIAGGCYIGIANVPWNHDLGLHKYWVYRGFIAFLIMTVFYTAAIIFEKTYPNRYAKAFGIFAIILFIQIIIMIYGPRAWHSNDSLLLQALAQKIVVYAEILVMLFQGFGALKLLEANSTPVSM